MNTTLPKALIAVVPTGMLLAGAAVSFVRRRSTWTLLQVLGAACLVLVALTHVCEALDLLPWMRWGAENSPGHYLDLTSAVLGLTLFPVGYLLQQTTRGKINGGEGR